ncbi:MAG: hypothetical protein Q8M69_25700 [Reyranella sp.]|jgi:hypothetical protein|nr:hypothetical protein [Reyranella sp.]
MWWMLVASQLLSPLSWVICLLTVGALWRLAHPVGVVMMSTVISSVIFEGIHTRFHFDYDNEDWFIAMALANLLTFAVIASILAAIIWSAFRRRAQ